MWRADGPERLKGHKDMPRLVAALDAHQRSLQIDKEKKVA